MAEIELTILMPCLNEAETVAQCVKDARTFLARTGVRGEVLIADNGSTDGSQSLAEAAGARVIPVPLRGYGAALYYGTLSARGSFVIMGDSDQSYDFSQLEGFVERLRAGDDLVMGNRFMGGIAAGAMPWKNRHIGNPVLSGIGRLLFRCPARDFHCGIRGYRKDAFLRMDLRTTGMEFASEMVVKATLLRMKISEVPTTLRKDGRSRPPHLRPWRDGWRHLRFMLLYSPNWLFLYPGLALSTAGLLLGGWLLPGPRHVGSIELDIHTLLYAGLAVLLGVQAVGLAVFSKVFAVAEGLLPESPRLRTFNRLASLEWGLALGAGLSVVGLLGVGRAATDWASRGFGPLNPSVTLRTALPGVLALVLGSQTLMWSFFLSVLRLRVRPLDEGRPGLSP